MERSIERPSRSSPGTWRRFVTAIRHLPDLVSEDRLRIGAVIVDLDNAYLPEDLVSRLKLIRHERAEAQLLARHLHRTAPVIDLGAGLGYTSCLADRWTDPSVTVKAVEANPRLIPVMERTRELNEASFDIEAVAYAATGNDVELNVKDGFWTTSRFASPGRRIDRVSVPARSLAQLVSDLPGDEYVQLIADVEGSEHELVDEELDVLQDRCRLLVVEFHDIPGEDPRETRNRLEGGGFRCIESVGDVEAYLNRELQDTMPA